MRVVISSLVAVLISAVAIAQSPKSGEGTASEKPKKNDFSKPATAEVRSIRVHPVPAGTAEAIAKSLQENYKNSPGTRIASAGSDKIVVFATAEQHLEVERALPPKPATAIVPLSRLDAPRLQQIFTAMYGGNHATGPIIESEPVRNALIIRGSENQIQEIKIILRALGETGQQDGNADFTIIPIEDASAVEVAKMLDELFNGPPATPNAQRDSTPRSNRIRVVADPASNSLLIKASAADLIAIRAILRKALDAGGSKDAAPPLPKPAAKPSSDQSR